MCGNQHDKSVILFGSIPKGIIFKDHFIREQKDIVEILYKRYIENGKKNFSFRVKNISKKLSYHPSVIGRSLGILSRQHIVKIEKNGKWSPYLWMTNF